MTSTRKRPCAPRVERSQSKTVGGNVQLRHESDVDWRRSFGRHFRRCDCRYNYRTIIDRRWRGGSYGNRTIRLPDNKPDATDNGPAQEEATMATMAAGSYRSGL